MCGIFGIIKNNKSKYDSNITKAILKRLALLSESRGKDSSGIAFRNHNCPDIEIVKGDIPVKQLLRNNHYLSMLNRYLDSSTENFLAFGHARLVTNGSQLEEVNNQPVVKDNIVCIHNGIITNVDEIWVKNKDIARDFLIDTEIIPSLIRRNLTKTSDVVDAVNSALTQCVGTYSIGLLLSDLDQFLLATNNGSLYYITDEKSYFIFASEGYMLEELKKDKKFKDLCNDEVKQLEANRAVIIDLTSLEISSFGLSENKQSIELKPLQVSKSIKIKNLSNIKSKEEVVIDPSIYINRNNEKHLFDLLEDNREAISKLKRCTKCLLPETFPFIEYDNEGVCNYCRNYKIKNQPKPISELEELVEPYRRKNKPDCIIPFSGGRDSTYTLHVAKEVLGLNPIAFTYDWGMVTDLARRNIARVCGNLGVENILVSANMHWKRENIRKNIFAWLKNPELGMIPLFMAGDKYFFYYCNQVKKQTGIDLNIWGINYLENTEFKTGFAGLPPKFDKKRIYSLSLKNQMKLFRFVGKNVLKSPGYINQSMIDSLGSFAVRYIAPKKDYYHLFDYYKWDENEINGLLKDKYDWELAIDTDSTWRIGDGTASFYNYIYYTVAGFSEFDTFRSNQIREGDIDRETALMLVNKENIARYETLRWYLDIIGLDFETVIKRVNQIPKLYEN